MTKTIHSDLGPYPQHSTLAVAISTILAGVNSAHAQQQEETAIQREYAGADQTVTEEVVVTARKIEESIQDIPGSIQALGEGELKRIGAQDLEAYSRFIPSMTYTAISPGASKITFRGVADSPGPFIAESSAAVYLDEQPLTQGSQQPDPRMVDIERVEALAGPQGALFGDQAQSGILRIITNKPDPTAFDANIDFMGRTGSESSESYDLSGMVNIPFANNRAALRLVGFTATDGGYIDNVPGVTPRFGLFDNVTDFPAVGEDINEIDYAGGRAALRWGMGDNWTGTAGYIYQRTYAKAFSDYDPTVGDLQTVKFFEDWRDDTWQQVALTFEGDLGFADFISATAYFDREIDYVIDRTTYANYFGTFCFYADPAVYYTFPGGNPGYYVAYPAYCFGGQTAYTNEVPNWNTLDQFNTRITQEFRLSSQGERWTWIAGLFWEQRTERWDYKTFAPGYANTIAYAYWSGLYGPLNTDEAWWNSGDDTEWDQIAVFGEATYDFNERWSLTFGGRYYDTSFEKLYFVERPNNRLDVGSNPTGQPEPGFSNPTGSDSGFLPKVSIRFRLDDEKMIYLLASQGFRAGGANRGRGNPARVVTPFIYESDILTNLEAGVKTRLAGGKVQFNATIFTMMWEDFQIEYNDPSFNFDPPEPFQTVVGNAGDASIDGIEIGLNAVPIRGLDIILNLAYYDAQLDEDVDPCKPVIGTPVQAECQGTTSIIPKGSRLPLSPEFKASFSTQYGWPMGTALEGFIRFDYSYTGESLNQLEPLTLNDGPNIQLVQEPYNVADLRFGVVGRTWEASIFVKNITDERAEIFNASGFLDPFWSATGLGGAANDASGKRRLTTVRPREFGVRFVKGWGAR